MNTGLDRSNLSYEVSLRPKNFYPNLLKRLRCNDGSIIIYRSNYHAVESLTRKLQEDSISAVSYHLGLSIDQRHLNRTQFSNNQAQVIVTTGAAGYDIYKLDVRIVIHYEPPQSIHSYLKETGKAGKDGKPSRCLLFASYQDMRNIVNSTERKSNLSPSAKEESYTELQKISDYITSNHCRLSLLANQPTTRCGRCDNCSESLSEFDWTIDAQKFLSCIARFDNCGRSFGASYTIEVLRGSTNIKIFRYEHNKISTYGIGKDKSAEYWRALGEFLLFHGLIEEIRVDDYSVLKLNDKSWEIMRGKRPVMVRSKTWITGERQFSAQKNHSRSLELYCQGVSVTEIAQTQGYQEQTVLRHLAKAITEGALIDIAPFVPSNDQVEILNALKTIGIAPLKPIYEYLNSRYDYGQINLVLAQWQKFGEPPQVINNITERKIYDGEYDYEEDFYAHEFDYLPEYDTSLDLGYLEDIANPNAY
jgi:superfamily II DNA helicase RecQ